MATLPDRQYARTFSGLKSTAITAGAFIIGGILIKEILQRLRRYPEEDKRRKAGEKVPDRGVEEWAMGYLYRARTFVAGAQTPDYSKWPLVWAWEAYKRPQSFYEQHCGADATVYLRFLRGTHFWIMGHTLITFPILLSINFIYSSDDISTNSIARASITSLVGSDGLHLLPIHTVFCWVIALSWIGNLSWVGYGALRIRRNELRRLLQEEVEQHQDGEGEQPHQHSPPTSLDLDPSIPPEDRGWRYRTVLVRNIPPPLRSEEAIRQYFEQFLNSPQPPSPSKVNLNQLDPTTPTSASPLRKDVIPLQDRKSEPSADSSAGPHSGFIAEIVLVRRHAELNELWEKYGEVLHQLETHHVALARAVMAWVAKKVKEAEAAKEEETPSVTPAEWWKSRLKTRKRREKEDLEKAARIGDHLLISTLRPFLTPSYSSADKPSHSTSSSSTDSSSSYSSIWDALSALRSAHPTILDRFQPLYKLKLFHSARVPAIDFFTAKHNLLYMLIDDKRAHADTSFSAASTAFVTFHRASDARRARQELAWRPIRRLYHGRVLDCKVSLAPEARDLHWPRLVMTSLQSDLLRGTILLILTWAATLVWLIPVSFLIGLFSLSSLTQRLPALAAFLERNPVANSVVTSLIPTAILAVLNMFVPTVLGIIQRKGKTLITESKWSAHTQESYWRFVVINFLVVFCIGITAFSSFLDAFRRPTSVLNVIASSFPNGATFFVGYMLLQCGIHCGIELSLLGISWINHGSIRKCIAPRKRALEGWPRFFGYQSWLPNHLFITSVCLIFAVLNPLVIPFGFVYFSLAVIVFKQQWAHVYYRRHFEGGGRLIFIRFFKYSLDILILSEIISVAFFWVLKRFSLGGAVIPLIPLTVATKVIGARWFDHLAQEIEEAKIDIICNEGDADVDLSVPLTTEDRNLHLTVAEAIDTVKTFATVTLPALALRPSSKLPHVASPSSAASHFKTRSETAARRERKPLSRKNSFYRPRSHTTPDDWNRPMLQTIMSREEGEEEGRLSSSLNGDHRYGRWAGPSDEGHEMQELAPPAGATAGFVEEAAKTAGIAAAGSASSTLTPVPTSSSSSIVTPHPPVIRDDRPVSHLRYRNPALSVPLSRTLWLPRDPLIPVDLGDTVDYHGRALVSSEGGRGVIGSWEEETCKGDEEDQVEVHELEQQVGVPQVEEPEGGAADATQQEESAHARVGSDELLMPQATSPVPPTAKELVRQASRLSITSGDGGLLRAYTLRGNERVRVAADVAAKIEAEQGGRQLSVLDSGTRRRGSSSASQRSNSIMSGLRRRGTRSSYGGGPASPVMLHSPHHSPVLNRHPDQPKPSPPSIPVFTDEPSSFEPSTTSKEEPEYPFPAPTSPSPRQRGNTGASLGPPSPSVQYARGRSPCDLSAGGSPGRLSATPSSSLPSPAAGPSSPTAQYPPTSPSSPTRTRTRTFRSPSLAASMQLSMHGSPLPRMSEEGVLALDEQQEILVHPDVPGDGGEPAVSLSQAAALRIELLEEERRAHAAHAEVQRKVTEQDRKDSSCTEGGAGSGWLRKLLVSDE
ncbi:hypothetical protein JCM8547_002898 [Rhodosporidiobolus lusitaniae]